MRCRTHRAASLVLLAILAWTPAQAVVCLGWCDGALAVGHAGHAAMHEGHAEKRAAAASEAPCHRTGSTDRAAVTSATLLGCNDPFDTLDMRVRPAPSRADAVALPAVAGPAIRAGQVFAQITRAVASAADSGPPAPAPTRAPLVLRI